MSAAIPHDHVRDVQDRSWTTRLVEVARAPDTSDDEREAAFATLVALEDHRSVQPLLRMLEDRALADEIRQSAADTLNEIDDTSSASQRAGWWDSGDDVLMDHAVGQMGRFEAELVVHVAGNDRSSLQVAALEAMAFDFGEAQFVPVLVRALGHEEARVRMTAAEVLIWDEPVAAEEPLLTAALDAESAVAEEALATLEWYPSRRVLRALAEFTSDDEDLRDQAASVFDSLRSSFMTALNVGNPAEQALTRDWMEPIADLLDLQDDSEPATRRPSSRVALPVSAHEIQAMLADPDGEWGARLETLGNVDWGGHAPAERDALRQEFAEHPDPEIRAISATAFGAWGDRDALILLLLDDSRNVRKEATLALGRLPHDPAIAPVAWARMLGESDARAEEALEAYIAHADASEAWPRLTELVLADPREAVRVQAVELLAGARAGEALTALVPLLREPPALSWALHITLLDAVRTLAVRVPAADLQALAAADHLYVSGAARGVLATVPS